MQGQHAYALVVDADDVWYGNLDKSELVLPAHCTWQAYDTGKTTILRILQLGYNWRFKGAVHEIATGPYKGPRPLIQSIGAVYTNDGSSSADPNKFARYAEMLEESLRKEPNDPRSVFYLAQIYNRMGNTDRAQALYLWRSIMGPGIDVEEVYISLLEAGREFLHIGLIEEAQGCFLKAHNMFKHRHEVSIELAKIFMIKAAGVDREVSGIFVEAIPDQITMVCGDTLRDQIKEALEAKTLGIFQATKRIG